MSEEVFQEVKGTSDLLPVIFQQTREIQSRLSECYESFGYQPVEVPIIEHLGLHLKKSGEEMRRKMYAFKDLGQRDLCLRPEFTASVVRAYVNHLQHHPSPLRLYYMGPTFRYDQPQRGRYRQFTQSGVEMFGAKSTAADAEVIYLACKGLDALGIREYSVSIGNIGITLSLLDCMELDEHRKVQIVEALESIRKEDDAVGKLRRRLDEIDEALDEDWKRYEGVPSQEGIDPMQAKGLVDGLISGSRSGFADGRDPDEIVERLLEKIRRRGQRPAVERVLAFVERLSEMHGAPDKVMQMAREVSAEYVLPSQPVDDLREVLSALSSYDFDWSRAEVDLAFGRGLAYYTGVIFEINCDSLEGQRQICGGGRYDGLVKALGGRGAPALGFAYGVERLRLAKYSLAGDATSDTDREMIRGFSHVLVCALNGASARYAHQVAERLRALGLRAEVDVMGRSPGKNLSHADRSGIPFAMVIGDDEVRHSVVKVKDLSNGQETSFPLHELGRVSELALSRSRR